MTVPYSELIATTLDLYSKSMTNSVIAKNALLNTLKDKKRITRAEGGKRAFESLIFAENDSVAFTEANGYANIGINTAQEITGATYSWKNLSGSVQISGNDLRENNGTRAVHKILTNKMDNLKVTFSNKMNKSLLNDGTDYGGNGIGGLDLLISEDPTLGTVGDIDRSTNTFWRNKVATFTDASLVASESTIRTLMNTLSSECGENGTQPDLILAGKTYYNYLQGATQTIQRIVSSTDQGKIGFQYLEYMGAMVALEYNMPVEKMFFINTDHIQLQYLGSELFNSLPVIRANSQQDVMVASKVFHGALTMNQANVHGVLIP